MTQRHSFATLVMPEEAGFDDATEFGEPFPEGTWLVYPQTALCRVDDLSLQHALDAFESACAPPLEVYRSVMARAVSNVHEPLGFHTSALSRSGLPPLHGLLSWGNAVWAHGGQCQFQTVFLSDAGQPPPIVFDDVWTQQLDDLDEADAEVTGQDEAVRVVDALEETLGLPKRDILKAAKIAKSSYHSWKKPNGPRPRVASQGRLWALAQTVEDLLDYTGGQVRQWLLAVPERRDLLVKGQFDRLISEAIADRPPSNAYGEPPWAATFGVGAEHAKPLGPAATPAQPLPPFKKARAAQALVRRERKVQ